MADELTESDLDEAVARTFGRTPSTSVEMFRQAGFCEEDAARGAVLLESGKYFGFVDVATSMGMFDGAEFRRRNPDVTGRRIAEVASRAQRDTTSVSEADLDALDDAVFGKLDGATRPVSESGFDALDDAIFGKPGEARR